MITVRRCGIEGARDRLGQVSKLGTTHKIGENNEAVPLCKVPFLSHCSFGGRGHKPRSLFGGSERLSKCINNGVERCSYK